MWLRIFFLSKHASLFITNRRMITGSYVKRKKSNKRSISITIPWACYAFFEIDGIIIHCAIHCAYVYRNFREIRQKADVVFHPENHTVSYFNRRWWFFEPELTNGSLNDRVTQLNTVAIVSKIRFFNFTPTDLRFTIATRFSRRNTRYDTGPMRCKVPFRWCSRHRTCTSRRR